MWLLYGYGLGLLAVFLVPFAVGLACAQLLDVWRCDDVQMNDCMMMDDWDMHFFAFAHISFSLAFSLFLS